MFLILFHHIWFFSFWLALNLEAFPRPVRLVHQRLNLLAPVQNLLDVLDHRSSPPRSRLHLVDAVGVRVGAKVLHLLPKKKKREREKKKTTTPGGEVTS